MDYFVGEGRAVDVGREEETGTRGMQGGKRRGDGCEERGQRELEVCGGRRGRGRERGGHGWRQPGGTVAILPCLVEKHSSKIVSR